MKNPMENDLKKGMTLWTLCLVLLLGGCGGGSGAGGGAPSNTVDPATVQKPGSQVGNTVAEVLRIAKGSLVLQGKLRPQAYPSSNLAAKSKSTLQAPSSSCPSITEPSVPTSNFFIIIDYGSGCVDSFDGIRRSGQITITVSDAVVNPDDNLTSGVITLAFTSYTIGEDSLGGSATIHVTSSTSETWDMSLTLSNSEETQALVFKSTVTYGPSTDIETVNGAGTYLSSRDGSFNFTLDDLQYDFETVQTPLTCPYPMGGSIALTTGFHMAKLTFGVPTPGCGLAFLSIDGGAEVTIQVGDAGSNPQVPLPGPSAPAGVSVEPDTGTIVVSWDAVEGATSYNLYMASQSGVTKGNYARLPDGKVFTSVTSPFSVTGLPAFTPFIYYFVVTAVDANGESGESAEVSAHPQMTWISRDSGTSHSLYGIASSGSDVVAVGALGTILTSSDGISWTSRSSDLSVHLYGVAASGTQFVAVGDSGTILVSSDLIHWVARSSGVTSRLRAVTWTGSQFVAVGDSGTILTSPDAAFWTEQTSGTINDLYGVGSSSSLILAVGSGSTILTSPTGTSWTQRVSQGGNILHNVVWSGTQFLAVGDGGQNNLQTSFDGITWTAQNPAWGNTVNSAAWSGTRFFTAGTAGTTQMSADGIAWTAGPFFTGWDLTGIAWFKNQFIAVGLNGTIHSLR